MPNKEKENYFDAELIPDVNVKNKEKNSGSDLDIFGFVINNEIQFDIKKNRMVNIISSDYDNSVTLKIITLKKTITKLLFFLLYNSKENVIYKEDILNEIWGRDILNEDKRLWHTIKELRRKLELMGVEQGFITSIRGQGYSLLNNDIYPLFYKKNYNE